MQIIMNRGLNPECASRIRESEAILLDIGDTLLKYFRLLSAACIAGVRVNNACPRYAARRLDFARNSIAGIVGIPEVGASMDYSNYALALCCYQQERTLDLLFVVGGGFRITPHRLQNPERNRVRAFAQDVSILFNSETAY